MDMRAEVWSPVQNCAVWLGAWLYGHESTDDLLQALTELGGRPETHDEAPFIDLLSELRANTAELIDAPFTQPLLRLVLAGPGDPPALPAGSRAAAAAADNNAGAIIARTNDPDSHFILIPHLRPNSTVWEAIYQEGPLPAPAWLSPGDADRLLAQATEQSALLIEATGMKSEKLPDPRLTVGTLSDFYDTPGLPSSIPGRAAKIFARADRVAAIIETVKERAADHRFDPQLLMLGRHIRAARVAGVSYALADFAR